jgi:hypothetical protein
VNDTKPEWEQRVADLWLHIENHKSEQFVALIDALVSELPAEHPVALFERGCAQDSTGHSDIAVPLYRAALRGGLSGIRRRRATIQIASSLRNIGQATEAVALLLAELNETSDELDGAVRAFLALALSDVGREREALSYSLLALAAYLPRYNRSLARYARDLGT